MAKKKLQRFAEMETFSNVIQPAFEEVFKKKYHTKGTWKQSCFGNDNPLVLELGCGKGEYTVGLAASFPDKNFVGVDIKGARIWKGARKALLEELSNVRFLRTRIELIDSFFGSNEVDEIWLTFPDPQLKKPRKRLSSPRFLNTYKLFLKNKGLIHLKTDNKELFEYTLGLAIQNHLEILIQTSDLYGSNMAGETLHIKTFYEQQFLAQGLKIHYLCFALSQNSEIIEPTFLRPGI
jgi:tRNA (guanine-N7-)-methyltransferase